MENNTPELSAASAAMLQLGAILGQIVAFAMVAGRCTAAQARFFKELRDQQTYKIVCPVWRDFCPL